MPGIRVNADDRLLAPADGLDRPVGEDRRDGRDGVETFDLDIGVEIGPHASTMMHLVLDGRGLGRRALYGWSFFGVRHCRCGLRATARPEHRMIKKKKKKKIDL